MHYKHKFLSTALIRIHIYDKKELFDVELLESTDNISLHSPF